MNTTNNNNFIDEKKYISTNSRFNNIKSEDIETHKINNHDPKIITNKQSTVTTNIDKDHLKENKAKKKNENCACQCLIF